MSQEQSSPLFCARCAVELTPGEGDFYVVRIEAFADPTAPTFREEDLSQDLASSWQQMVDQLSDLSAQEALDQVHRRLTIHLCARCYRQWIENPV